MQFSRLLTLDLAHALYQQQQQNITILKQVFTNIVLKNDLYFLLSEIKLKSQGVLYNCKSSINRKRNENLAQFFVCFSRKLWLTVWWNSR